ncbi:hypothetical protein NQ314_003744, partial [Rhamnusium bicolor]
MKESDLIKLEALKKKRSISKGQLTRFQTFLNNLDINKLDFVELETRLVNAVTLLEEFNVIQLDIEKLDVETEQTIHDNERDKFEQNYYATISRAKHFLMNKPVEKFWELEQINNAKTLSPEEAACEMHFINHFNRNDEGRFIVSIPFKQSPQLLGTSKEQAQRRFYNLEPDLLSRGLEPKHVSSSDLWWNGPEWLSQPEVTWPKPKFNLFNDDNCPQEISTEIKRPTVRIFVATHGLDVIHKYSSFVKLQRVVAYCLRFKVNCQTPKQSRLTGPLSPRELSSVILGLIYLVQHEAFPGKISSLKRYDSVDKKSKILALNPFLDSGEVIRVGGRLKHSNYEFCKKHPAILPANNHLSTLLAEYEHKRLLHADPQTTLASLRENYWIISGRNLVKRVTRRCLRCLRFNPTDV